MICEWIMLFWIGKENLEQNSLDQHLNWATCEFNDNLCYIKSKYFEFLVAISHILLIDKIDKIYGARILNADTRSKIIWPTYIIYSWSIFFFFSIFTSMSFHYAFLEHIAFNYWCVNCHKRIQFWLVKLLYKITRPFKKQWAKKQQNT